MLLVSGAGVGCKHRDGRFAAGRPLRLGVTADAVNDLRAEAQLWCPISSPSSITLATSRSPLFIHPLLSFLRVSREAELSGRTALTESTPMVDTAVRRERLRHCSTNHSGDVTEWSLSGSATVDTHETAAAQAKQKIKKKE